MNWPGPAGKVALIHAVEGGFQRTTEASVQVLIACPDGSQSECLVAFTGDPSASANPRLRLSRRRKFPVRPPKRPYLENACGHDSQLHRVNRLSSFTQRFSEKCGILAVVLGNHNMDAGTGARLIATLHAVLDVTITALAVVFGLLVMLPVVLAARGLRAMPQRHR
jgi:hypothetical protein